MSTTLDTDHPARIRAGCAQIGLDLSPAAITNLDAYLDLIIKWNAVHNLTAVREKSKMVTLHLLDSLVVAPHLIRGARLLDVGSGAGLPGIPLAIARPDLFVTLLDSNQKKTAFMHQAATSLHLQNVSVAAKRVEQLDPAMIFDVVIARAFAELADFVSLARAHVAPGGRMLAMKGVYPHDELQRLTANVAVEQIVPLRVPGLDAERHLIILAPQ